MSNNIYQDFLKEWNRITVGKTENEITNKVKDLLYAGMIIEGALCQVCCKDNELVLNFKIDDDTAFSFTDSEVKELLKSVGNNNSKKSPPVTQQNNENDIVVINEDLNSESNRIEDVAMPICETINVKEYISHKNLILLWDGKANDIRVTMADEKVFLPSDACKNNKIIIPINNVQAGVKIHISLYGNVKNLHYKWNNDGLEL